MNEKQVMIGEDLLVELTLHNFSASLLTEFASKIVKPYFNGNLNIAIRMLMEKALSEEVIFTQTIK